MAKAAVVIAEVVKIVISICKKATGTRTVAFCIPPSFRLG
jgi:hypothetical protein